MSYQYKRFTTALISPNLMAHCQPSFHFSTWFAKQHANTKLQKNQQHFNKISIAMKFINPLSVHLIPFCLLSLVAAAPTMDTSPSSQLASSHPFVGFFVFPHGGITLNPESHDFTDDGGSRIGSREAAIRLHDGMASAAKALMETNPDILILSTPHGYYLDKTLVFVGNPSVKQMSGNAGWEWANFSASFDIAQDETRHLYSELRKGNNPVQLLSFGVGQSPMSLQWGEVIPWTFIQDAATELGIPPPSVIYIGQPPTRNIPALKKVGQDLATVVKTADIFKDKRIAVLVSGDLSHYHANDSKSPYPYHPNSGVFDAQIVSWGKTDRTPETEEDSTEYLLKRAEAVSDSAGSCGYNGLVMMHSVISSLVKDGSGSKFRAKFYEYAVPTYFGMIVTSWIGVE